MLIGDMNDTFLWIAWVVFRVEEEMDMMEEEDRDNFTIVAWIAISMMQKII